MGKRRRGQDSPRKITFFVRGVPKAQPRGRTFFHPTAKGKDGKVGKFVTLSTPSKHPVIAWRDAIAMEAHVHRSARQWTGPVRLDLLFLMPRPKAHFRMRKGTVTDELKPGVLGFHVTTPDRDNCDKPIMDEMKVGGYFKDDSQVCWGVIGKVYCPEGKPVGCVVRVTFLEDTPQVVEELLSEFADELGEI